MQTEMIVNLFVCIQSREARADHQWSLETIVETLFDAMCEET